jgi:ParB family chromosome partitioning protein
MGQKPPPEIEELAHRVESDGGQVVALYREPVGNNWQIFAMLPLDLVDATPFQRDLSRPHVERLQKVIKKLGRFLDPVVAVRAAEGRYWIPNGNHRREALLKLKAKQIPVILIPDRELAFQILALNTEKAHNLKDKSLEVIRMYRALAEAQSSKKEEDYAFEFEEAYYITLGILYERHPRFSGGAFSPILRRVDGFLAERFSQALKVRQSRAELVEAANEALSNAVARVRRRGINHPYLKNFLIARSNPLARARKRLPDFEAALSKLKENLESLDPSKIRIEDIARAAAVQQE